VKRQIIILGGFMAETPEPGTFRKMMSDMGGRTFLLVTVFSVTVVGLATLLIFKQGEFQPEHWLDALKWCVTLISVLLGKRVAEEIGSSFGKVKGDDSG